MNKPNRKFSPKPTGGERNERPRRPRTNDENRGAGFSDKRYSPMLDPDDNKEWQQRDKEGRRYRPASGEGEGPRRPRSGGSDFRSDGPRGDGPRRDSRRNDGPRGDGPRGDGPRYGAPRGDSPRREGRPDGRPNFRKTEGGDGEQRFRPSGSGNGPRFSNRPGGENRYGDRSESAGRSDFRRGGEGADQGDYKRRSNREDGNKSSYRSGGQDSEGGFRTSRSFNRNEDGFSSTPRYGNKAAGGRSEGFGNTRGEGYRSEGRSDSPRRDERSSDAPRTGRRGESRFDDSRSNERRSNSGQRGESRFSSPYNSEGKTSRSRKSDDEGFEGREKGSFKKKISSEPKVSSTSTPPTYDFSKIRGKAPKVAHTDAVIRLNKYIADAGICSRRDADELIATGQIKVNGEVITQMGHKVSRNDTVTYNGRKINPEKLVYVLLNKPKDFITTTEDPHERKTVMELVSNAADQRIYPVGRLDRNTTGLLLLTNDGELAEKLSHPSHKVKKVYQVLLDKPLTDEDFEKIQQGVVLEDGPAPVDEISYVIPEKTVIGVEIHIGRNRIVRRIFESLGYEVQGLDRVIYAGLTKKDLPRSHWRYLSEKEVIRLKHFS